ncbi:glutaredoxin-C9-like [Olea europaea var. sylvestris]|uniref:glutaredoxin-C9-like n=1 Tax=Olea europaea var. sylvestris TaxID=158386 RepID=UPI000C1D111D|nr:glutaredoxin-C9-like [Olea europaea var. sylvestris]
MHEPILYGNLLLQQKPPTLRNPNLNPNPNNVKGIKENASSLYDFSDLKNMVKDNAVIVFGKKGCCMSHVIKRLLQALGVNPAVYEVDEVDENEVVIELEGIRAGDGKQCSMQFPAVFIGGRWFGGLERIIASHITGELTPLLKQAGALWL